MFWTKQVIQFFGTQYRKHFINQQIGNCSQSICLF